MTILANKHFPHLTITSQALEQAQAQAAQLNMTEEELGAAAAYAQTQDSESIPRDFTPEQVNKVLKFAEILNGLAERTAGISEVYADAAENLTTTDTEMKNDVPTLKGIIKNNLNEILAKEPVAKVTGKEITGKNKKNIIDSSLNEFTKRSNKVTRKGFGDVQLAKSGLQKLLNSGFSDAKKPLLRRCSM